MVFTWREGSDGSYSVLALGAAAPESAITSFALEGEGGSIQGADGVFAAELPAPGQGEPPVNGPHFLIGYNAQGAEVLRRNIEDEIASGRPPN